MRFRCRMWHVFLFGTVLGVLAASAADHEPLSSREILIADFEGDTYADEKGSGAILFGSIIAGGAGTGKRLAGVGRERAFARVE